MMQAALRRLTSIPLLLGLSALAACATRTAAPPIVDTGAPAPTPAYDWFLHQEEDRRALAFGVANSDEVKLQLFCRPGSGALQLAATSEKPARQIHLESGGDTERYPATSEAAGIHDGEYLRAEASTKDPVIQRFRRLGWIAAWHGDQREVYAAHPGSQKGVSDFFAACG